MFTAFAQQTVERLCMWRVGRRIDEIRLSDSDFVTVAQGRFLCDPLPTTEYTIGATEVDGRVPARVTTSLDLHVST